MCVLALAWRAHPRWALVVVANRDERHARPAAPLARTGHVIAGRDLESGGTWLGVDTRGRFAALTNLRGYDVPEGAPSRGGLVDAALAGEPVADADGYAAFNLVSVGADGAWVATNRPLATRTALAPGLHGVTNGPFDEPWAKTVALQAGLAEWLAGAADEPARLLDGLRDDRAHGPDPRDAVFIADPVYGTRCSTVVAIDRAGAGVAIERRFAADTRVTGETRVAFEWGE